MTYKLDRSWGSRTSAGADVDGRAGAAWVQHQQHWQGYHDPRAGGRQLSWKCQPPPSGPDTLLACLLVSPSCPAAAQTTYLLFFPLHSLLLHFSVARKTLHRHWHGVSADCTQNSKSSLAALDASQHRLPAKDLHPTEVYFYGMIDIVE